MKTMIRGIFFDFFGTLLECNAPEQSWDDWAQQYYAFIKNKTTMSFDDFSRSCEGMFSQKVVKDPNKDLTTYETRISEHCNRLSIPLTRPELKQIADETPSHWQKYFFITSDAIQTLKTLRKDKVIALITNFDHGPHIRHILESSQLGQYFDQIIISDEVGYAKPDKSIFEIALRKTNLSPEEVIFVGDNYNDDIQGARNAGIRPVMVKYSTSANIHDYSHSHKREEKMIATDAETIHSLTELLNII